MSAELFQFQDNQKVGVCVKTLGGEIISLSGACNRVCNQKIGDVCTKGCMTLYPQLPECAALNEGMSHQKNVSLDGVNVDAVIVNDGRHLTTMIYTLEVDQDKLRKQEEYLRDKGLTRSEIRIMQMALDGMSNAQIAEKLFISKATLKTHLNNIYKKLPPIVKQMKNKMRS